MNFLAHLWLADRTGTSLAGSVLGDVVRGADLSAYPDEIALGIRLHRRVDALTDRHPALQILRERFAPGARRYAGIVLDLACDHALAQNWAHLHPQPLEDFCEQAGTALQADSDWFVAAGGRAVEAEAFARLLLSYREPAGIEHALRRVAARLRRSQPLLEAAADWQRQIEPLRDALPLVLDDLEAAVRSAAAQRA